MTFTLHEQVLDNLSDGITIQDTAFTIIYQNKAMVRTFGMQCGRKCYEIYERRGAVCDGCGLRRAFETGQANLVLRTAIQADERTSFWENACIPLFDDEGRIIAGVEVCRDVSERISLEEEVKERNIRLGQLNRQLRESEEKYRIQFEKALDAIFVADAETGVLLDCNPAALRLLDKERAEVVGHHHRELHPPEALDGEFAEVFRQHLNDREGEVLEAEIVRGNGERRDVTIMANTFDLRGRRVLQGVFRDVTEKRRAERERRHLEAQLKHAQKLEAIGHLAAGIAHEINTPAQYVGDNIRFLREAFADIDVLLNELTQMLADAGKETAAEELLTRLNSLLMGRDLDYLIDEIPKAIDQSLEGVGHVANIVRAMKEFAHPGAAQKQLLDLNRAVQNAVTVSRNEWKYVADVVTALDSTLPPVPCFAGDFNQAILNLIVNAAHAVADKVAENPGEKGTITMQTRRNGDWAEIRVVDSGTGIPDDLRGRVFDPFFTTKEVGRGSGQGLAIAHSVIVQKHGGTLHFETEMGTGTAFVIKLPIADTMSLVTQH